MEEDKKKKKEITKNSSYEAIITLLSNMGFSKEEIEAVVSDKKIVADLVHLYRLR